jgi:hypothetical protein
MSCRPLRGMRVAQTLREMLAGQRTTQPRTCGRVPRLGGSGEPSSETLPRGATRRSKLDCAGPAANNSGLKSDCTPTREQRSEVTRSEANGIDCGAGRFASALRREGCGSRPCKGAGELGEGRQGAGTCESASSGVRSRRRPTDGFGAGSRWQIWFRNLNVRGLPALENLITGGVQKTASGRHAQRPPGLTQGAWRHGLPLLLRAKRGHERLVTAFSLSGSRTSSTVGIASREGPARTSCREPARRRVRSTARAESAHVSEPLDSTAQLVSGDARVALGGVEVLVSE